VITLNYQKATSIKDTLQEVYDSFTEAPAWLIEDIQRSIELLEAQLEIEELEFSPMKIRKPKEYE
jgi:hypothetical protein